MSPKKSPRLRGLAHFEIKKALSSLTKIKDLELSLRNLEERVNDHKAVAKEAVATAVELGFFSIEDIQAATQLGSMDPWTKCLLDLQEAPKV